MGIDENKLYETSGYVDIRYLLSTEYTFIFVIGGRGTGKTYGALKTLVEDNIPFFMLRRTQSQADLIKTPEFNPFKKLNSDLDWRIIAKPVTKYNSAFYATEIDNGQELLSGMPIGLTGALSTLANTRGFDASDMDLLLYDEFIPEAQERDIRDEGIAFLNAYETINRNRELQGAPALRVLGLSNSNYIANPLFMELGLVRVIDAMKRKGKQVFVDDERSLAVIDLGKSTISEQKKHTAIYRLAPEKSKFFGMAVNNDFSSDEIGRIKSCNLKEFIPLVAIGEICIYKHKADRLLYVSTHKSGSPPEYGTGDMEKSRFRKKYAWLWLEYVKDRVIFEEYLAEVLLTKYIT